MKKNPHQFSAAPKAMPLRWLAVCWKPMMWCAFLAGLFSAGLVLMGPGEAIRSAGIPRAAGTVSDSPPGKMRRGPDGGLWAAWVAACAIEDAVAREAALKQLAASILHKGFANVLHGSGQDNFDEGAALALIGYWMTFNPGEAAAWVQQTKGDLRHRLLGETALRWAEINLTDAAAWAESLSDLEDRAVVFETLGSEAIRTDPLLALNLALEMPPGLDQTELIRRAAAEWAGKDRVNAATWAAKLEDGVVRQRVMEDIAAALADPDPIGAARIVLDGMLPGEAQDRALVSIVQRWVQTDPVSAARWVAGFPADGLGRDAVDNLVSLWAISDSAASEAWLQSLPDGTMRTAGMALQAQSAAGTAPAVVEPGQTP
jgi:hypothetical protein